MTPKEKSKELFMRNFEITVDDYCAKQCALIAVDEIIKSEPTFNSSIFQGSFLISDNTEYWEEVKQEIEKL